MIIICSTLTGVSISSYKKRQISYIDMLIIICERISIMLNHSLPDTAEIINSLKQDSRLDDFDFSLNKIALNDLSLKQKVQQLFSDLGRYDAQTQIKLNDELSSELRLLKEKYQQDYNSHHRLYLSFGVLLGMMLSVIII